MTYVYIDESGDIGSKSQYMVLAAIITERHRQLEKALKKIWLAKPQYHGRGRLHSTDVDDGTRIRVLSKIAELDLKIKIKHFKKHRTIREQQKQYYQELALFVQEFDDAHIIIIERRDTRKKRSSVINELDLENVFRNVVFGDPHAYKQLQAVDFVAWAYGRYIEYNDQSFCKIIEARND